MPCVLRRPRRLLPVGYCWPQLRSTACLYSLADLLELARRADFYHGIEVGQFQELADAGAGILYTQPLTGRPRSSFEERQDPDSGSVQGRDVCQIQHDFFAVTMGQCYAAQNIHFFSGDDSSRAAQKHAVFQIVDIHYQHKPPRFPLFCH